MKAIQIKKVLGYKSMVINDINCDLRSAYKESKGNGLSFYVNIEGKLQMWGLFSVCEFLGIKDVSKF